MGQTAILRLGFLGALCLPLLPAPPAMAQEAGGVQIVVGIEQGIEIGRNVDLEFPDEGRSVAATTRLSFGISSETRIQRLSFEADGGFRIEDVEGETDVGFESPASALDYTRTGATGSLDISAVYARDRVDTLRTLDDIVTDGGEIPVDFEDLTGTGQRTAYGADATLILGRDAPLGFRFDLGASAIDYTDTTDDDLTDSRRARIRAETRARFSQVLTGILGAGYERIAEDDETETDRSIRDVDIGLSYLVSPRATLDASVGYVWNRTEETTGITDTNGVTGRLALGYDMPNGVAGAVLDARRTDDGDSVLSFRLSRSLDLPDGRLSASIGVARPENDDATLIGTLDWEQPLPTGRITALFDRGVGVTGDGETRITTILGADYAYDINDLSSFGLGLGYALSEVTATEERTEQINVTATYRRNLTRDWDFNAAVGYRLREESDSGRATSPLASVTIGRTFSTRR